MRTGPRHPFPPAPSFIAQNLVCGGRASFQSKERENGLQLGRSSNQPSVFQNLGFLLSSFLYSLFMHILDITLLVAMSLLRLTLTLCLIALTFHDKFKKILSGKDEGQQSVEWMSSGPGITTKESSPSVHADVAMMKILLYCYFDIHIMNLVWIWSQAGLFSFNI